MTVRDAPAVPPPPYRVSPPKLVGGALCLDFVNTVGWRGAPARKERLTSYGELMAWAVAAGALDRKRQAGLAAAAKARPAAAAAILSQALALREVLAEIFGTSSPRPALLDRLNAWLGRAPERTAVTRGDHGYRWRASTAGDALAQPLWPIVWSAADILTSGRTARVRSCADRRCGWMFLDASRGVRRRWCSMEECGNRAKARRHYRRHGAPQQPAS